MNTKEYAQDFIRERVIEIICSKTKRNERDVKNASSFNDLGVDSLASMEIIMGLEDTFNIQVPEEEQSKITNVDKVVDLISNLVK